MAHSAAEPFRRAKRFFLWLFPAEVTGQFPETDGPVIFVSNHNSPLDGGYVWALLRRRIYFLVAARAFSPRRPLIAGPLIWTGQIPVNQEDRYSRHNPTSGAMALRTAEAFLKEGGAIGISPEGSCQPEGQIAPIERGVIRLAFASGAKIVLVGIRGSSRVMADLGQWPHLFRPVQIVIGETIDVSDRPNTLANRRWLRQLLGQRLAELSGQQAPAHSGTQSGEQTTSRR